MGGGGFMQSYMRIFGQESIGRPDLDAQNEVQVIRKFLAKKMDETSIPEIRPILVFTSDEVEVEPGDSPIPAMKLKQLKEFLRQGAKSRAISSQEIKSLTDQLEQEI